MADGEADPAFAELLETARGDDRVVGLFLGGSRGKGDAATERSDYDVYLITRHPLPADDGTYRARPGLIDLIPFSLEQFRSHAEPGDAMEWNRYTFAHVSVLLDKLDGTISELVSAKGRLPSDVARTQTAEALDGYINDFDRSLKNARDGRPLASQLDAAESIPYLLWMLFALFERVRPFNKFLEWELRTHPLPGGLWSADRLLPRIGQIVATGDIDTQRRLYLDVEPLAIEHGHGGVVDAWGHDLPLIRGEE
jgi:hypothetical protein